MLTSKKSFLQIIFSLYVVSALAACNLPAPKDKAESSAQNNKNANFTMQAMADKSKSLETSVQGNFELPAAKIYNFMACAKDVAYDKAIAGHDFLVEEVNQKVTSDKSGCVTWAEQVNYNYLGDSQYVRIERNIKGLGLFKGSQRVAFAINPWSHGENSSPVLNPDDGNDIPHLVDDEQKAELALKGFSADSGLIQRPLWVEDGRLFVTEQKLDKDGVVLLVEMRPNATIQLTKMNGEMYSRALTAGSFKARMKLIHIYQQNNKEIRRQLSESEFFDVTIGNGSLAIKSAMSLPAIPTRGQMMLALELAPVGGPQGLKNFEGIYFLGEYDQLKGASFLKINTVVTQTKDFKIQNYITATLNDVAHNKDSGVVDDETYQKPKVEVSQLEFRFIRVGEEKTSTREVFYNIRACVRHGLDQKATRSHTFKITKFKQSAGEVGTSVNVKTDNNSCLNWDESIKFNVFDCQHYLKGHVQIESAELGMNEKLDIIVNPWESNGGAVARDVRYVDPTEKPVLNCQKEDRPRTQVVADGYTYNTLSYNYGIDSLLNMTVTKKILFKMDPRLLIYSSLSNGRAEVQRFRDGVYLLRLAIVQNRDYDDSKNTYVTSVDKLVNVLSGQISTEVSFQTQDLKALGNRNNLLVEIYPIDESKVMTSGNEAQLKDASQPLSSAIDTATSLETPTFMGPITLNIDEATRALRVLDASAVSALLLNGQGQNNNNGKNVIQTVVNEGLKANAKKIQEVRARADRNVFVKENNLELINLKTADNEAPLVKSLIGTSQLRSNLIVTKADLQDLLKTGTLSPAVAQKLCAFWGSDYFKKLYANKGGVTTGMLNAFGLQCYQAVVKNPEKFFQWEKQLFVKEVGGSRFVRGLNHGLTVGTNFSLNAAKSNYKTTSTSFNAKIGISKKFLDLFSLGMDLGYTMTWGTSDSTSASNTISVNSSTSMTVQQNTFQVRVTKHEQCAVVRLNPALFIKDTKSWFGSTDFIGFLNPALTDEEKVVATTRGLLICDGEIKTEAKDITENYYLIAQESGSTQMQDMGDARNRNFFIALRSTNDFNRFVLAMRGQIKMPVTSEAKDDSQGDATSLVENLFKLSGPTYPGMYLVK